MMPARNMLIRSESESQAFGAAMLGQYWPEQLGAEVRSRNEAMNSNTAAPITTPSPRVRERMFT